MPPPTPHYRDMVYVPYFIMCSLVLFDVNVTAALRKGDEPTDQPRKPRQGESQRTS